LKARSERRWQREKPSSWRSPTGGRERRRSDGDGGGGGSRVGQKERKITHSLGFCFCGLWPI
jgi:hypothetical protein